MFKPKIIYNISFNYLRENKILFVERLFLLFLCLLGGAIVHTFLFEKDSFKLAFLLFVIIDSRLVGKRSRLCFFKGVNENKNFFTSTLPLSRYDFFAINIIDSFLYLTPVFLLLAIATPLFFWNTYLAWEVWLTGVVVYFQLIFMRSIPNYYRIADVDNRKPRTLMEYFGNALLGFFAYVPNVLLVLFNIIVLSMLINMKPLVSVLSSDSFTFVGFVLVFLDAFLIYVNFVKNPVMINEHRKYEKENSSLGMKYTFHAKLFLILSTLTIVTSTFSYLHKENNKLIFFAMLKLDVIQEGIFIDLKSNDVYSLREKLLSNNYEEIKYEWYKKSDLINYAINENNLTGLRVMLGDDVKQWQNNFCTHFAQNKVCSEVSFFAESLEKDSNQIYSYILMDKKYKLNARVAQKALLKFSKRCDARGMDNLLKRGIDPTLKEIGSEKSIYGVLMSRRKNKKCSQILAKLISRTDF